MNILKRFTTWLRDEGYAGQYLRPYELARYGWTDNQEWDSITVPPDAPTFADVSFYQARMNWDLYPHDAAFLRLGQNTWKDSEFEYNYQECKSRGILLGGYWFWDDRSSPQTQFEIIKSMMAGKTFEMELIIDDERTYSGAYADPKYMLELMQLIEGAGIKCRQVGIYTGYYWWTDKRLPKLTQAQKDYLSARPLWLAWYASASVVKVPAPWTVATHWQYDTIIADWGQPTAEIDANRFVGTQAQFDARYKGSTPNGEPMEHYYKLTNNSSTNYRSIRAPHPTSHIQGSYIGQINPSGTGKGVFIDKYTYTADVVVNGTVMAKAGDVWHHCFEANGAPIDGWVAEIHKGVVYLIVDEIGAPPPVVDDEIEILVNGVREYYIIGKLQ